MYSNRVPTYTIDLEADESERWDEVIENDVRVAVKLAEEAEEDYECLPRIVRSGLGAIVSFGYKLWGGRYLGELQAWAYALGRPLRDVILMNCSYVMSHVIDINVYGCTAGIRWIPNKGYVHVRSLDWPLKNIGKATRLFRFKDGNRSFTAVGVAGQIGVLSGMVPRAYSVTLNWAPRYGRPKFDFGPTFLLRETLETCDTFEDAVSVLTNTVLSTPAFFTVCGTRRGEACVIERVQDAAAVRRIKGATITQANHHVAHKFVANNTDEEVLECSIERSDTLEHALQETKATSLEGVAECLDVGLVCNEDSYQQMAFCPKTGEIKVWRWV